MFNGWLDVIAIVGLTVAAATTGSIFRPGPFYDSLKKPSWNPPDWLFPIAWTILYAMIAFAGWLVWREAGVSVVMAVWLAQLGCNALWSYLAFGLQRFDWAFWEVGLLWLATALFTVLAWPISQLASVLFMPYLAWVTFAAVLNLTIWRLNPERAAGVRS
jgi:tryptophan-rich sensory protein